MTRFLSIFALTALPIVAAAQASLPDELNHLEALTESETRLVDGMRDFQQLQNGLIEWDRDLIREYQIAGDTALAEAKRDDIRRRLYLIEAGWRYVVGHYPNNAPAMNYLGEFYYDYTSRQIEAVQLWMQAEAVDREYAPVHNNLGVHYLHSGSTRLALRHLHEALSLDDESPDYYFNLAQAYLLHSKEVERWYDQKPKKIYQNAMEFSRRASELDPEDFALAQDYAVNFFAAEDFGVEADWSKAADAWDRVIALSTNPTRRYFANLNKARVAMRMNDFSTARRHLERCIEIDPDQDVPRELLADINARTLSDG